VDNLIKNNVKWLIEDFSEENNSFSEVFKVANELGFETKLCNLNDSFNNKLDGYWSDNECVICHTSIQTAMNIMKFKPNWFPIAWFKQEFFQCKYYYPFFGDYLFNNDYVMIPTGDVVRRINELYNWLGKDNKIFIRPNSSYKTFTGQIFNYNNFLAHWDIITKYGGSSTDLVVISSPKLILKEFRYVIGNNKIISKSEYSWDKDKQLDNVPEYVDDYVKNVLKNIKYYPDPVYVLDVCLDEKFKPHVLEVNCFNTSDLYNCNKYDVVEKISKIAYLEYNDIF